MPRFDAYRNPNPRAQHGLYLDVQSDLVLTATRWCIPMLRYAPGDPLMSRAQQRVQLAGEQWLLDTPNILAVPTTMLRDMAGQLPADDRLLAEASLDFMLRGY